MTLLAQMYEKFYSIFGRIKYYMENSKSPFFRSLDSWMWLKRGILAVYREIRCVTGILEPFYFHTNIHAHEGVCEKISQSKKAIFA